jgi:hypothetical protein
MLVVHMSEEDLNEEDQPAIKLELLLPPSPLPKLRDVYIFPS